MRDQDPRRLALLRDLLMDYPSEKAPNHGEPPAGLTDDEQDQWAEEFLQRNLGDEPLEGRYDGELGRTDARMVNPDSAAHDDVEAMGWYTNFNMPKAGERPADPYDMNEGPSRLLALQQRLMRRG